MNTGFDIDLLNVELVSLKDTIDLSEFEIIAPLFDDDDENWRKRRKMNPMTMMKKMKTCLRD